MGCCRWYLSTGWDLALVTLWPCGPDSCPPAGFGASLLFLCGGHHDTQMSPFVHLRELAVRGSSQYSHLIDVQTGAQRAYLACLEPLSQPTAPSPWRGPGSQSHPLGLGSPADCYWPQETGRCLGTELDGQGHFQTNLVSTPYFLLQT